MKTKKDYNYRQYTVYFDLDIDEEKEVVKWIDEHSEKRKGFSVILRKMMIEFVKKNMENKYAVKT